eukprot:4868291-Prorocentrum_lima.AAC.1
MAVPPPPGRDPMTGSVAIAALTTGRHAQSVATVQRAGLHRRSAAAPSLAPPCATPIGGKGTGPASRSAASAAG